jgi:hypothetical protein
MFISLLARLSVMANLEEGELVNIGKRCKGVHTGLTLIPAFIQEIIISS